MSRKRNLKLYKYHVEDGYFSLSGWGDMLSASASWDSNCRDSSYKNSFSKHAVVAYNKSEAYVHLAKRLNISVAKAKREYRLIYKDYNGRKSVGEWLSDGGAYHAVSYKGL